jgi:peroxiredoxin
MAPPFRLRDADGDVVALHEILRERAAALVFYHGGWCRPCVGLLGDLSVMAPAVEDHMALLAISNESRPRTQTLQRRLNLQLSVLIDDNSSVLAQYDLLQGLRRFALWRGAQRIDLIPCVAVVHRDGSVRRTWLGHLKAGGATAEAMTARLSSDAAS